MRRAHDPSGFRRRRLWLRPYPQQQAGDAGGLGCQRQLAAGDEIELTRLPPDFQHHDAQRIAGQRIGGGPQRGIDIGGAHRHEETRIETEFGQSVHRQRARFNFGEILPYPQQRTSRANAPGKPCDKTSRASTLPAGLGKHLVHRPHREATLQQRVGVGMAERHPVRPVRIAMRLDAFDAPTQTRKHVRACAGHAPLQGGWAATGLK
jgi:hypothetical protein